MLSKTIRKIAPVWFVLLSTIAIAEPEIKGNPEDLRKFLYPNDKIVTISSDAQERAYSDKAIVSLVISTEDEKLSKSIEKNAELRTQISRKLIGAGLGAENIKSSKFSTAPQYSWFGKRPTSFKVINRMAITIYEENQLKEIATVADNNKEVELADTAFEHTKNEEFNNKVKMQALDKVMQQKMLYEKRLGVKLLPIAFRDSRIANRGTRGALALEEIIVTAAKREDHSSSTAIMREGPMESSFDEIQYDASISVDFKIEGTANP